MAGLNYHIYFLSVSIFIECKFKNTSLTLNHRQFLQRVVALIKEWQSVAVEIWVPKHTEGFKEVKAKGRFQR
jgi:hypothetical protein